MRAGEDCLADNVVTINDSLNMSDFPHNDSNKNSAIIIDNILEGVNKFSDFQSATKMQSILNEFTEIYTEKINRLNNSTGKNEDMLKKKVSVLEAWVEDLGEQNSVLVTTVEELEKEARHRVELLQAKLEKMAYITKETCIAIRDHQSQATQQMHSEEKYREELLALEQSNKSLLQENLNLKDDLNCLIEVISKGRINGKCDLLEKKFKFIIPEKVFGSDTSLSLKDYSVGYPEDSPKCRKGSTSSGGSLCSTDTENDHQNQRFRSELKALRETNRYTNSLLIQRDKHIADLQVQLTDLHHELESVRSQLNCSTTEIQDLREESRHTAIEICLRDEAIRHMAQKEASLIPEDDLQKLKDNVDVELQLSDNIDVLSARLSDLEEECEELRHQNEVLTSAHARCAPTINQLQDQLNSSHLSIEDLRTILAAEVSERQNQLLSVRGQLHEVRQQHMECLEELKVKNELVDKMKERGKQMFVNNSDVDSPHPNMSCQSTQTEQSHNLGRDARFDFTVEISRLENELSEKSILLRELQSHLATSRREILLKDQTLHNVEKKLDSTRRGFEEQDDRMNYLTSQLTYLQLELSRLHGTSEHLRMQLEGKSKLVKKLEAENESLGWHLNEKSSSLEHLQKEISNFESEIAKRKKEVYDQKVTIGTLQEALVSTKRTCDKLRKHNEFQSDFRDTSLPEHRLLIQNNNMEDNTTVPTNSEDKSSPSAPSTASSMSNNDSSSLISHSTNIDIEMSHLFSSDNYLSSKSSSYRDSGPKSLLFLSNQKNVSTILRCSPDSISTSKTIAPSSTVSLMSQNSGEIKHV